MIVGHVDLRDEALDGLGAVGDGAIAEELIHDLPPAHADVLVRLKGVTDVDLDVAGGDEFHAANLMGGERGGRE